MHYSLRGLRWSLLTLLCSVAVVSADSIAGSLVWSGDLTQNNAGCDGGQGCDVGPTTTSDGFTLGLDGADVRTLDAYLDVSESFTVTSPGWFTLTGSAAISYSGLPCDPGGNCDDSLYCYYNASAEIYAPGPGTGLMGSKTVLYTPGEPPLMMFSLGGSGHDNYYLADGAYTVEGVVTAIVGGGDPQIYGSYEVSVDPGFTAPEPRSGVLFIGIMLAGGVLIRRRWMNSGIVP
jgi:hypothetical protein